MPFCSQENNLDFMNVHHLKSGFVGIDPFPYYIYNGNNKSRRATQHKGGPSPANNGMINKFIVRSLISHISQRSNVEIYCIINNNLLVLSREWMGMGVAGMIITSDYGSFRKKKKQVSTSKSSTTNPNFSSFPARNVGFPPISPCLT
jgi:hypothetical protein